MADEGKVELESKSEDAPSNDIVAGLRAKLDETANDLNKIKEADAKRQAADSEAEKKKEQKKKIDSGKAQEEIDKLNEELRAAQEAVSSYRAEQKSRIESLVKQLPEEKQQSVAKWGEKMALSDYEEFVRGMFDSSDKALDAPARPVAPPSLTPQGYKKLPDGKRELQPETISILEEYGYDNAIEVGRGLSAQDERFGLSNQKFIKLLKERSGRSQKMTREKSDEFFRR